MVFDIESLTSGVTRLVIKVYPLCKCVAPTFSGSSSKITMVAWIGYGYVITPHMIFFEMQLIIRAKMPGYDWKRLIKSKSSPFAPFRG